MSADALWSLGAAGLVARFAEGSATPEAVLEAVLARIGAANPRLNAIVTLDEEGARAAAAESGRRWRQGAPLGPLDGVPLTVKDNLFVGGLRATWGSLLYADHIAPQDDLPVARLRAGGTVILGKTNTPELALAGYTDNRVFGPTGNPWAPELTPGGSSGGAVAAVAAGFGPLAIATDAGGSIRRPAGHAGVAGLKPGTGRVPRRHGFPPLAHDLQVIGAVARSVADLRLAFDLMAGDGGGDPLPPGPLRIGAFGKVGKAPVDPGVSRAFDAACAVLRALGHSVEAIPAPWAQEEVDALFGELTGPGVARVMAGVLGWEERVTPAIARQALAGQRRSAAEHVATLDRLTRFRWAMQDAISACDLLATPSAACLPWPKAEPFPARIAGQEAGPRGGAIFSTAINLAGLPALVVPAPRGPGALPSGLQLVGPMRSEEKLLELAGQFESLSPWPCLAPL